MQASDLQLFRGSLNDITSLMTFDLDAILRDALSAGADPARIRDLLLEVIPETVQPYMDMASESAAAWYEDMRRQAVAGPFQAQAFTALDTGKVKAPSGLVAKPDQLGATIRNGLAPLFGKSDSSPLMLIGGGMQRHVANAARGTIIGNANRDPVKVGYQRFASTGCCKFCAMVASRGAVYKSDATAGGVQGRGVDASVTKGKRGGQGKGVKARGSQALGSRYHDHCRCVVGPVFVGDQFAIQSREAAEARYDAINNEEYERDLARKAKQ